MITQTQGFEILDDFSNPRRVNVIIGTGKTVFLKNILTQAPDETIYSDVLTRITSEISQGALEIFRKFYKHEGYTEPKTEGQFSIASMIDLFLQKEKDILLIDDYDAFLSPAIAQNFFTYIEFVFKSDKQFFLVVKQDSVYDIALLSCVIRLKRLILS